MAYGLHLEKLKIIQLIFELENLVVNNKVNRVFVSELSVW